MPGSMPEGKQFIKNFFGWYIGEEDSARVLDVGPGSGNYYDLLNNRGEYEGYPGAALSNIEWTAVEIFPNYIDFFNLHSKYSSIIISDIYDVDWEELGWFDVVIFGDVLEHMEESRGREVIAKAVEHAGAVIISLPIVDYPQGSSYGNEHEAHIEQYTPERMRKILSEYYIIDSYEGEIIGTYIFRLKVA
jgi:2-polyprenyl-3-methyl-5-hydroxy-6-metoxy-1,4-benzoquinol methylase